MESGCYQIRVMMPAGEHPRSRKSPRAPRGAGNSVRIIGGGWRGRRVGLCGFCRVCARLPDRVRETLFNWLQDGHRRARAVSICSQVPAPWGSKPCPAAPSRWCSSNRRRPRPGAWWRNSGASAAAPARALVEMGASRFLSGPRKSQFEVRVSRSAVRGQRQPWTDSFRCLRCRPLGGRPVDLVYLENERAARGFPTDSPSHWELLKSKSAGEVGYHLARVTARAGT